MSRYSDRIAAGLCVDCRVPHKGPKPYCDACYARRRKAETQSRERQKEREAQELARLQRKFF